MRADVLIQNISGAESFVGTRRSEKEYLLEKHFADPISLMSIRLLPISLFCRVVSKVCFLAELCGIDADASRCSNTKYLRR